ncbi:MAG: hypothetical protein NZ585_01045 [Chloracidobacterium sp.]|nr:hypothetical protein [Chloracidobacterium sp.]MDW8216408.1 hypothetical protein [Acidobacteriota bacterium]
MKSLAVSFTVALSLTGAFVFGQSPSSAGQPAPSPAGPIRFAEGRYELGRRTRALERAWMACRDADRRAAAIPRVQTAVLGFFSGNTGIVAQSLDETTAALRGQTPDAADRWAAALSVTPARALIDRRESMLDVTIAALYEVNMPRPNLTLRLALGKAVTTVQLTAATPLPHRVRVACEPAAQDQDVDTALEVTVGTPDNPTRHTWRIGLSRARDLDRRLAALETAVASITKSLAPDTFDIERATLTMWLNLLKALREKPPLETDLAAAGLLRDAERLAAALRATPPRSTLTNLTGEALVSLPTAKGTLPVRAWANPDAPVLVIAFHGAGGSENMFFDGYGDGELVRLCRARGWAAACPRVTSPLDDYGPVIERLPARLAPKAKQIFIVGHSLGAVTTLVVATKYADRLAGIAPISGRAPGATGALKTLPTFVAAGTKDFSRPGSEQLAERLRAQETPTTFKLYEAEHLLVVPDALPDIFTWMDELVRRRSSTPPGM